MMKKKQISQKNIYLNRELFSGLGIIALLTLIAYWPVFQNGFVNWDDPYYVYKNEVIARLNMKTIKTLFSTETVVMGNWHPLTMISLAMDRAVWGLNPLGYHLTNVIIHIFNSFLAGYLVLQLFGKKYAALICALAFALHPLHIESVAWITERKDVLFTFFYFLAWICWNQADTKKSYYLLALVFFSAACLSKAMAVTLPVILALTEYLKARNTRILSLIPFLILAVIFGLTGISAQKSAEALSYQDHYIWFDNVQIAGYGIWFYLMKLIFPWPLSAFYPYPLKMDSGLPPEFLAGFILSVILVISIIFLLVKRERNFVFFAGFFLITVFPVIQLIPLGEAMAADRYMYLSSWAVFAGVTLGILHLGERFNLSVKSLLILPVVMLGAWTFLIWKRLPVWESGKTLWEDVIAQYPDQYFAWNNLGTLYYDTKEYDSAIPVFQQVLKLNPEYKDGHNNLGTIYATREQYDSAVYHFSRAVEIDSGYTAALFNLGYAYGITNRTEQGLPLLIKAAKNGHAGAQQILVKNGITW